MNRLYSALLAALVLLPLTGPVSAQTNVAPAKPTTQTTTQTATTQSDQPRIRALMVLNARAARIENNKLSLDGASTSAIVFADRPVRRAGYMHTADLVNLWSTGSFAKDPPNATISAFTRDGGELSDAVVVLKSLKVDGDRLTFDIDVLEGSLGKADGPAAIFIDTIWFGVGSEGIHYLGTSQTTGGTSPALGSRNDTSNPNGWSNPAPGGPPSRRPSDPPTPPPLTSPPGSR
jgi:hypothetical protein